MRESPAGFRQHRPTSPEWAEGVRRSPEISFTPCPRPSHYGANIRSSCRPHLSQVRTFSRPDQGRGHLNL
jgi:hypothetical protein